MIIKYITLYKILTQEDGASPWEAVVTINDIRKMDVNIKKALWKWLENGIIPHLEINGVSLHDLTAKEDEFDENMTPIRAFLMLDWIKREPVVALHYLSVRRMHASRQPLTEETKEFLDKRLAELEADLAEEEKTVVNNDDESCKKGEDIVISSEDE